MQRPPEPIAKLLFYYAILDILLICFVYAVYVVFVLNFKDTNNTVCFSSPPLQPDPHQARPEGGAPRYLTLELLHCPDPAAARGFWIVSGQAPFSESTGNVSTTFICLQITETK